MKVFQQLTFNRINSAILKSALLSALLAFTSLNASAVSYTFTSLGAIGPQGAVRDINNAGVIIGTRDNSVIGVHATTWNGSVATDLGAPGKISYGYGINDLGQSVGQEGGNGFTAKVWSNGTSISLDTPSVVTNGVKTSSIANDINNTGQVVGSTYGIDSVATLWNGTTATYLDSLGSNVSAAYAINDSSQIVGSIDINGATQAVLWNGTAATNLDGNFNFSIAYDINNAGQIVGQTNSSATLWDNGVTTDLGSLAGGRSLARGINSLGQIVGDSDGSAFLWENGVMTDLNSLVNLSVSGLRFITANGINDSGSIVGYLLDVNTNVRYGYLLSTNTGTPSNVPAPAALWLFASGLGSFGVAKRRCKKV
jgi:probable HAF family extracellular repeat protein